MAGADDISFKEVVQNKTWRDAMKEEIKSIEKNKTWSLVDLPVGKKPISVKWVYKVKLNPDGGIAKHKARLVARGFMQQEGYDFTDVFAPVARFETVRILVSLASSNNWRLWQLDVKSAFLNGPLEEEVYVHQPPGFEVTGHENKVMKLHKSLYGLKHAPRAWNKRIDSFLTGTGFRKCIVEHRVYVKQVNEVVIMFICLYVDDLVIIGASDHEIEKVKNDLKLEFEMSDLGELSYFLGIQFEKVENGIVMHQNKYMTEVLKRFNMAQCNPVNVPVETNLKLEAFEKEASVNETLFRQLVGCLRFICHSRPEIAYGVGLVSRFMANPKQSHLIAAKRILRYIKGTLSY